MRPDSLYTDVAVNTCCQCLNKNFPYHHVYQDKCVARYILLPELILAEHGKCHLASSRGSSEALIWHLKTLNMVERIQMHSLKEAMETWRTASFYQVLYYFSYSDKEQEIPSIFCFEPIVVYSTRRKIKSVTRELFEIPWCLKTLGMWEAISYWWCLFQKQLEQNHVNIIDWEIWCWFWFFWFQSYVFVFQTHSTHGK